jgi:ubiquitin-protein ligase
MAWKEPPQENPRDMHESPRIRRLRSDLAAMERLRDESSVMRFRASGKPIQHYIIEFQGKSLARFGGRVKISERHEVEIKLGASYPRTMPELRWLTPIYHPNISEIGMVCLGGYGTHWVPSLNLDELCGMLWDMARYHNYDVRSPYNREAALWVANQSTFAFPTDVRPLRDLRAALGRIEDPSHHEPVKPSPQPRPAVAEPGSKAGRYSLFVRRFAEELDKITPSAMPRSSGPPAETARDAGREAAPSHAAALSSEDLIFVVEEDPAPSHGDTASRRLRAADEDILFIE